MPLLLAMLGGFSATLYVFRARSATWAAAATEVAERLFHVTGRADSYPEESLIGLGGHELAGFSLLLFVCDARDRWEILASILHLPVTLAS